MDQPPEISPDWQDEEPLADPRHRKYAGRAAAGVIFPNPTLLSSALKVANAENKPPVLHLEDGHYMLTNMDDNTTPEHLDGCYLIPHYESEGVDWIKREGVALHDRTARFFGAAIQDINQRTDSATLRADTEHYRATLRAVLAANHDFSTGTRYSRLTENEQACLAEGAQLVGKMVNRLDRLGEVILKKNLHKGSTDAATQKIKAEFKYYYDLLIFGEGTANLSGKKFGLIPTNAPPPEPPVGGMELVRSVPQYDGRPDHDGVLSYFIHEIGKVMGPELRSLSSSANMIDTPVEVEKKLNAMRETIDMRNSEGVTRYVGWSVAAIDKARGVMLQLIDHPQFRRYVKESAVRHPETNEAGLNISGYHDILAKFTDVARARACIAGKDSKAFAPIEQEFRALEATLKKFNEQLLEDGNRADVSGDPKLNVSREHALSFAQTGVDLIANMAYTRMPRDYNAPKLESRPERERESSIGRLASKIKAWQRTVPKDISRARTDEQ